MIVSKGRFNSKELTEYLRKLAATPHDWSEDGVVSKGEALAQLLFKKALGYTEKKIDDEGVESVILHKPEAWAMQVIYDRLEGKTPQAIAEDEGRLKAADRVRDLAKQRLNALAGVTSPPPGPPKFTPKKKTDE